MRALIWGLFAVLILGWTGMAWVSVELTQWVFTAIGSGDAAQAAQTVATWPVPAWLSLWVTPELIRLVQAMWVDVVGWAAAILPSMEGLSGLVSVLVWVFWAFGALLLLGLAFVLHWMIGRAKPRHSAP
ncbi:MAG: hypothetical protein RL758_1450 [Pseudomonadota bacterium]|jgi:hypothetical protein